MMYAFTFDAGTCTGCKACQAACKDKNVLPTGLLWRRVYEVSGGEWMQEGEAWHNTVFAYNLSIACNHCVHPKCAGVCPADAYSVRPDGIVLIDSRKCIGCGYCGWACPYDAPRMDHANGRMTKCDLCHDNLDAGLPPACVAACPMRCLELVQCEQEDLENQGLKLWELPGTEHPYPLPKFSRTEPHLLLKPHHAMTNEGYGARVSNREETAPLDRIGDARQEIPLVIFSLLVQMAVGAVWAITALHWLVGDGSPYIQIFGVPWLSVGLLMVIGIMASIFHMGRPFSAWRSLSHLRKSWLSREILSVLIFSTTWITLTCLWQLQLVSSTNSSILLLILAVLGLWIIHSMQNIYRLRSKPGWNTGRTYLEFLLSAIGLGSLLVATLLQRDLPWSLLSCLVLVSLVAMLTALHATVNFNNPEHALLRCLRTGVLIASVSGAILYFISPPGFRQVCLLFAFSFLLAEEVIGRWQFYSRCTPGI
jgi:anaerobic dimethyl sulfoxide reductase subunit B (iron-sulfur subunit)